MRRLFALLIVTAGLPALSGCALSIHPLHSKDTVVKSGPLRGDWVVPQKRKNVTETYEFDWGGRADHSYDVTYIKTSKGEEVEVAYWEAYLVKLGDAYYLDARPSGFELTEAPSQQLYVIGLHALFRVEFKEGEEIKLLPLNIGVINETIVKTKTNHIMNENGSPVLLLETKELQQFLIKHGESFVVKDQKQPALLLKPQPKKPKTKPAPRATTPKGSSQSVVAGSKSERGGMVGNS
jgi:hypothetical protein